MENKLLRIVLFLFLFIFYLFNSLPNKLSFVNTSKTIVVELIQSNVQQISLPLGSDFSMLKEYVEENYDDSIYHDNYILANNEKIELPLINNQRINLNNSNKETLMKLPGIGETIASRIIEYRNNKPFLAIIDILKIKGIGEKKYEKLKDYIMV